MKNRAVGYIRVSTDDQADSGLGLESQRLQVEAQAIVSDLDLVDVIEDAGFSAKCLERSGLARLMDKVNAGEVDVIITAKLDRLTRSLEDLLHLLKVLGKARRATGGKGVDLVSCSESLDTSTATGELMIHLLGAIGQRDRKTIGERTRSAMAVARKQGRLISGRAPFGYRAGDDGYLELDEREQGIIKRVENLREAGESWQSVADTLTAEGQRTRTGRPFSSSGLQQIWRRRREVAA
jgi:site-specific DNA recombinase